jgi:UrcA family protein
VIPDAVETDDQGLGEGCAGGRRARQHQEQAKDCQRARHLARTVRPHALFDKSLPSAVAYGDLNLATPAGANALRARVDRAAMRVKGEVDPRDLAGMAELRKARAAAQEAADQIIGAHRGTPYANLPAPPSKVHL